MRCEKCYGLGYEVCPGTLSKIDCECLIKKKEKWLMSRQVFMRINGHLHKIEVFRDEGASGLEVFKDNKMIERVDRVQGSATQLAMWLMRKYEPETDV
jgi:hypothetical protein